MSRFTSTEFALDTIPRTAAWHFKLLFHAAVLRIAEQFHPDELPEECSFLESYVKEASELAALDPKSRHSSNEWLLQLAAWERTAPANLPLRALSAKGELDSGSMTLLMCIGLIEEDSRFGGLIEWAQPGSPGQQRPTNALLTAWWRDEQDCTSIRAALRNLLHLGLIEIVNPDAPRIHWAYSPVALLWDVLRGDSAPPSLSWLRFHAADSTPALSSLILPEDIHSKSRAIPRLLETGSARAVIVRGPLHNGRRTLLRAIAKELDAGTLEIAAPLKPEDERWRWLGTLAMILGAMPVFSFDLGPGETLTLPELPGFRGPIGVALSKHGGLSGSLAESAVLVEVPTPGTNLREHLWTLALNRTNPTWTGRFHLTSGGIMRAAALARGQATLEGRSNIEERDVRHANRALQQPLETLARRLEACGGWSGMVVAQDVFSELHALENRCRYREKLSQAVGAAAAGTLNRGVRALFSGPSGAGKTLAARLLAGELGMDLYRVDLSAVVNKYIGESEKNLNQVFSRAEELDVVLLLDEGDALLTARTSVQSSNDRYANLETNYLLQRIESFEGILIVTTNAPQSIDSAFQRRMDVVVQFRLPEPEERWNIWQLHLPADHEVDQAWLEDVAVRCTLSGGQIRNAVLHAALVAMDDGGRLRFTHVEQAVQREYRKMGSVCPLRRPAQAGR